MTYLKEYDIMDIEEFRVEKIEINENAMEDIFNYVTKKQEILIIFMRKVFFVESLKEI